MATIDKRGPYQYRARVRRAGYPDQIKTFRTHEEAEVWAEEIELEFKKGVFQCRKESQTTTVADALRRYAREVTPTKKGWREEERKINSLLTADFVQLPLAELRGLDLKMWSEAELKSGYAANTVRLKLAIVSNLYTVARKLWNMGHMDNPVMAMKLPQVRNSRDRRVLPADERRLLEVASPVMQQYVVLAIETAMRRSELLGLKWEDVYPDRVRLRDTKNGRPRAVPLSTRARGMLQERRGDLDLVFPYHPDTVSHWFQEICTEAGLSGVRLHDLRHEGISRLFEKGLSMVEVMSISGHKTTSQLLRYTHLQTDSLVSKLG